MEQRISANEVLRRTFAAFGANLGPFMALGLIVFSPLLLVYLGIPLWRMSVAGGGGDDVTVIVEVFSKLLEGIFTYLLAAAVIFGVFQHLFASRDPFRDSGRFSWSVGESLGVARSRFWSVLGTAIGVGLLTMLGLMLCIVPGILVALSCFVAIPAVIVEGLPPGEGMSRSWKLTEGHRVSIFFIVLVLQVLTLVVVAPLGAALGLAGPLIPFSNFLLLLVSIPFGILGAVASAVVYHDLRWLEEDLDEEQLAAIFD